MTKKAFKAFADDASAARIDGLSIENGSDRIKLFGELELTRDKQGLAQAKRLKAILDSAVEELENDGGLADKVESFDDPVTKANPLLG